MVRLFVPVGPVIVDAQGGDEMCARPQHYALTATSICRTCNAPPHECANPDIPCRRITTRECIKAFKSNDPARLHALYRYKCKNAWWKVDFGGDKYGINSATCTETLHAAKNGYINHFLRFTFMKKFSARNCEIFDKTAKWLNTFPRHQGETHFGRLRFKDGITRLTHTTANQKHSILKCFVMVLLQDKPAKMITRRHKQKGWHDLIQVSELLLAFLAWSSMDEYWLANDSQALTDAEEALKQMMRYIQDLAPRDTGQGWNITKVHEIKHMAVDIQRYGTPLNTNTEATEHNHITHAKKPAKTVKKERLMFDYNVANRAIDNVIIETASNLFNFREEKATSKTNVAAVSSPTSENNQKTSPIESFHGSTKAEFTVHAHFDPMDGHQYFSNIKWVTRSGLSFDLSPEVQLFLKQWIISHAGVAFNGSASVRLHTEYNRDDVVFRAHPDYQGNGPWNDWVLVHWEGLEPLPAQVQIFFEWNPPNQIGNCAMAVVHSVVAQPELSSILTRCAVMEMNANGTPLFHVVEGSCLGHHVAMFPCDNKRNEVYQWRPLAEWSKQFHE